MPTKAQQAYEKLEHDQNVLLEGVGPALVAVAITSKPHLDQRRAGQKSKRIEIVKINGEKVVKIPLMEKALYKHPNGNLNFNDPFISRLIDNFNKKVTGKPVYLDFRHGDNQGALAYLDPEDGGWLERGKDDDWLYAYGKPVVDNIEQMVRQWPHASVEFAPNYEANFVQKLSSDEMTEITMEELVPLAPKVVRTVKLFDQPRDDMGRFASGKGGASHAAAVGVAGGGLPGAVVGAIAAKAGLNSKASGLIGGAVGGGPVGLLGSYVTQKSLEGGSNYLPSIAKGMATGIIGGVTVGVIGLTAIAVAAKLSKKDIDIAKIPKPAVGIQEYGFGVNRGEIINGGTVKNEEKSDDTSEKIAGALLYFNQMKNKPKVLAIDVGKKDIPGATNGYLVLSAEEVDELLSKYKLEVNMNILEDGTATLSADEVSQVQSLQDKVVRLEAKVAELTPKPEPQLPEAFRVQLEELQAANRRLEAERRAEKVNLVLERARNYRDGRGYGHDKTFLELAEAALKLEAYEQNGSTIRLEDEAGKPNPVAFYSKVIMTMLEKVPGTVPMNGKTQADDYRLEASDTHYTAEEFEKAQAEFWN